MSVFVDTAHGLLNISAVQTAARKNNGRYQLLGADGQVLEHEAFEFDETVVAIIAVNCDWQCLIPCEGEEQKTEILEVPVIAWGLNAVGMTVPITPMDPGGTKGEYALRRAGTVPVWTPGSQYELAEAWLKSTTAR